MNIRVNSALVYFTDMADKELNYEISCTQLRPREDCLATLVVDVPPSGFKLVKVYIRNFYFDDFVHFSKLRSGENVRILKKKTGSEEAKNSESKEEKAARADLSYKWGKERKNKSEFKVLTVNSDLKNSDLEFEFLDNFLLKIRTSEQEKLSENDKKHYL